LTTALIPRTWLGQLSRWTRRMTTLDVDVADAETVARPAARSADTKAAIAYLIASGATAISIIENETGCAFRVGIKIDARAAVVHWLREGEATAVMRQARRLAGKSPDIAQAENALHRAAAETRTVLTEHATAMMRAGEAAAKLDRYMDSLRGTGVLKEFTKAYRRKRLAAGLRGEGFMSYGNAELRLRKALIPLLQGGGKPAVGQSLFAQIFDR
jgi:hypothetical protein